MYHHKAKSPQRQISAAWETPYLCRSLHDCLTLFARNIVGNLSSIPPVWQQGSCIGFNRVQSTVLCTALEQKANVGLQVMVYLLCIINSSSSLTFETTNLKKPAGNEDFNMERSKGTVPLAQVLQTLAAHTVGKHVPRLLV